MSAYPVLALDQTTMTAGEQPAQWTSAMTYKFVGALRSLTDDKPYQRTAIWIGDRLIGFVTETAAQGHQVARPVHQAFVAAARVGFSTDFSARRGACSPRPTRRRSAASSTCTTSAWFAAGGVAVELRQHAAASASRQAERRCRRT